MRSLDEITRDLAEVQDQLLATARTDHATRSSLRTRQGALRVEARRFAGELADPRSTAEIKLELKVRRGQIDAVAKERIDLVKQSSTFTGTAPDAIPEATLNRKLMAALGAGKIEARIAHLEQLLEKRGES